MSQIVWVGLALGLIALSYLVVYKFVIPWVLPRALGIAGDAAILATGTQARAKIIDVEQTGAMVNDQPRCRIRVRVEPENAPAFEADIVRVVPLIQLAQIQPGAMLTVAFDPNDLTKVAIVTIGNESSGSREMDARLQEAQALLQRLNRPGVGLKASAEIRAFRPTGHVVEGSNIVASLDLMVRPETGDAFASTLLGVFGPEGLHKYQVGREVAVLYDPEARETVTVELEALDANA